jgi:hypothetical protein
LSNGIIKLRVERVWKKSITILICPLINKNNLFNSSIIEQGSDSVEKIHDTKLTVTELISNKKVAFRYGRTLCSSSFNIIRSRDFEGKKGMKIREENE